MANKRSNNLNRAEQNMANHSGRDRKHHKITKANKKKSMLFLWSKRTHFKRFSVAYSYDIERKKLKKRRNRTDYV